jgi:hypothetical protein
MVHQPMDKEKKTATVYADLTPNSGVPVKYTVAVFFTQVKQPHVP